MKLTNLYESTGKSIKDLDPYTPDPYTGNYVYNRGDLTSLEGAPRVILGYFNCAFNKLTSLDYSPRLIKGNFLCQTNKLTSLIGCPQEVYGVYSFEYNLLTSLEGLPPNTNASLYCDSNQLASLQYAPEYITVSFSCAYNKIKSLEFAPRHIGANFVCQCNEIHSLVGVDDFIDFIGDCFDIAENPIAEGGLGLMLIKGLKKIEAKIRPLQIIDKYLNKQDAIYDCQQELIEKGFEDFAQL